MVLDLTMFSSFEIVVKDLAMKHMKIINNIKDLSENNKIDAVLDNKEVNVVLDNKEINNILKAIEEYTARENLPDIKNGIVEIIKFSESLLQESKSIPVVYDLLLTIFSKTSQLERQHFFHKLLDVYYNCLFCDDNKTPLILKDEFEDQIKKLIPYIKVKIIANCSKNKTKTLESISELIEVILYPKILREECYKIVRNKLGTENYEFIKYEIHFIEERPGFLGDYYNLNIFIKYQKIEETIHCFAKFVPTTNDTCICIANSCFKKEIFFYKDFIPMMEMIAHEGMTNFSPKCFLTKSNEYIILEDLSYNQYSSASLGVPAKYDWLVLVIKQLAKFHACSFIYEEKFSKKTGKTIRLGEVYKSYLGEYLLSETKIEGTANLVGTQTTISYLLDKFKDSVINKYFTIDQIKIKTVRAFKKMYKDLKESNLYRNVICHGDVWGSNILTKNNKNGKPDSCCLVDYQIIRYCPPVIDILFLLYINTDKSTRNKYYQELLDIYYFELKSILNRHEINIHEIYNYATFLEACTFYKITVICMVFAYAQIIFIPKEIMSTIIGNFEKSTAYFTGDRSSVLNEVMKHDLFAGKIKDNIEDLCEELKINTNL